MRSSLRNNCLAGKYTVIENLCMQGILNYYKKCNRKFTIKITILYTYKNTYCEFNASTHVHFRKYGCVKGQRLINSAVQCLETNKSQNEAETRGQSSFCQRSNSTSWLRWSALLCPSTSFLPPTSRPSLSFQMERNSLFNFGRGTIPKAKEVSGYQRELSGDALLSTS